METGKERAPRPWWVRFVLRSAVGGAACGLAFAAMLAVFLIYSDRPASWNRDALRVIQTQAQPLSRLDDKFSELSSGFVFTVDVENTTKRDITLPQALTVMGQSRGSRALHGSFLKLDRDYFLPARHVVSLSLESDQLCAAKYDPKKCFDSYFKDDDEIVIFDNSAKYELHIPIPSLTLSPGRMMISPSS